MRIGAEQPEHRAAVLALNDAAFGGSGESELINKLDEAGLILASLVAIEDQRVVGHILFSRLAVEVEGRAVAAAALAPMCVSPSRQRQSIGSALVKAGIEEMRKQRQEAIVVLGHEAFYQRFGFSHDLVRHLDCPFNQHKAFMGLELVPGVLGGRQGTCTYPSAFGV
jgi:putative acetyltransferase